MIFDGLKFRLSQKIVTLPLKDEQGNWHPYVNPLRAHYAVFGRVVPAGTPGAIRTQWWSRKDSTPVYAVPIPLKGHSLTNMAYGEDGKVYLIRDGQIYVSSLAQG
jgi:hypothetical protein